MIFLYLDESGDLGFDFVTKKPSKFFTITILALNGIDKNRALINAVKHTLKRKLKIKSLKKGTIPELKAYKTSLEVKKYFYHQVSGLKFELYSLTLNKRRLYEKLAKEKERVYNYLARLVLEKVPLDIYHYLSHENLGLQAVDIFCWGIFRKYERKDVSWFNVFGEEKIIYDEVFLP